MMIQHRLERYSRQDLDRISAVYHETIATAPSTHVQLRQMIADIEEEGGRFWVLRDQKLIVGLLMLSAVPGLSGLFDMELGIVPQRRREGLGSAFLQMAQNELAGSHVRQITYAVTDVAGAEASFLQANGFVVAHDEWQMQRPSLDPLPPLDAALAARVTTLDRISAETTFMMLYDEIFAPHPWYQPFNRREVVDMLELAEDMLFLMDGSRPIGISWLQIDGTKGRIEPFGIVPDWQGKGLGRGLMTVTLHTLARRGARQALIGAWRKNQPAIHLYQSMGFVPFQTTTYFAKTLSP